MRKAFKEIDGERKRFTGVFKRLGQKNNWYHGFDTTVLLENICDECGNVVTDHLWFNFTKGFEAIDDLRPGDVVEFVARVKKYEKGYVNYRLGIYDRTTDYKLSRPTKVRLVERQSVSA